MLPRQQLSGSHPLWGGHLFTLCYAKLLVRVPQSNGLTLGIVSIVSAPMGFDLSKAAHKPPLRRSAHVENAA